MSYQSDLLKKMLKNNFEPYLKKQGYKKRNFVFSKNKNFLISVVQIQLSQHNFDADIRFYINYRIESACGEGTVGLSNRVEFKGNSMLEYLGDKDESCCQTYFNEVFDAFVEQHTYVENYLTFEGAASFLKETMHPDFLRTLLCIAKDEKENSLNCFRKIIESYNDDWSYGPIIKEYLKENNISLVAAI